MRERTSFDPPKHPVILKVYVAVAWCFWWNDELEREFAISQVTVLDRRGLEPKCLGVFCKRVLVNDANAPEAALDASDGDLNTAGLQWFLVLLDCGSNNYEVNVSKVDGCRGSVALGARTYLLRP